MKKKYLIGIGILVFAMMVAAGFYKGESLAAKKKPYGVFLGIDQSSIKKLYNYKRVVIDAEYFSKSSIEKLHKKGITVYTYLNVGSVENFRDYYDEYEQYTLGEYENWEEERWVDVSKEAWQKHVIRLAKQYKKKGVDGFFIDNCDVYYVYHKDRIYQGLTDILKELRSLKKEVIINGGDSYITAYMDENGSAKEIMTGVNQEDVFTNYDFEKKKCGVQDKETSAYYKQYIKRCKKDGSKVFLLEYTKDASLIKKIKAYCKKKSYYYYVSPSIELI
ncbi:MAG: endo alpha-1,4 polygalactosaminidase [Lachnospiraceae bacterium]|nr:endo alpha-1,4 polygalactosaminidase [Lachnospiraceae bacterium]